jgi:hypothetical protein
MITIQYENGGELSLEDQEGNAIYSAWHASLDHGTAVIVIQGDKWINVDRATVARMLTPATLEGMTEDRHP